ncbi:MAG: biotin transporter BioY [Coprobacillaceae bacterium]
MNKKMSIKEMTIVACFTAVICVCSQISIPMPYGVPMTLQTLIIPIVGIVLGTRLGTITTVLYIVLGIIGLPVFAGFTGGIGILFGPTGGFIISFPILALTAGIGSTKDNKAMLWLYLILGTIINYIVGMLIFSLVTNYSLAIAFSACVLPFIPTAIIKIGLTYLFGVRMKELVGRRVAIL